MDLSVDKIRSMIVEARRLDVKEGDTDPDSGSNPIDDGQTDVLTDEAVDEGGTDGTEAEFRGLVGALNEDEAADLLALLYVGRGDYDIDEWATARQLAGERNASSGDLADYLLGIPNLGDLLDEGLDAMGETLTDETGGDPDLEETEDEDGEMLEGFEGMNGSPTASRRCEVPSAFLPPRILRGLRLSVLPGDGQARCPVPLRALPMADAAHSSDLIQQAVVFLGAAAVAVPAFRFIGLSAILGYLVAGMAIGPSGLAYFTDPNTLFGIAEIGVVMFLFVIGLELKVSQLVAMRRDIAWLGGLQMIPTTLLLMGGLMLIGLRWNAALAVGVATALSATSIALQILQERGHMSHVYGKKTFAILLFQDLSSCRSWRSCRCSPSVPATASTRPPRRSPP